MKYIITESKLNKVMNIYLDSLITDKDIIQLYPYIIIYNNSDKDNPVEIMNFDRRNGNLWIKPQFINLIDSLFGRSRLETKNFLVNWFENKFGVNSLYVD